MSREVSYYCEGPGCDTWIRSTAPAPRTGWLLVIVGDPDGAHPSHDFCSWECAIRYGAARPVPEIIDLTA
jgi:hypothetical protein